MDRVVPRAELCARVGWIDGARIVGLGQFQAEVAARQYEVMKFGLVPQAPWQEKRRQGRRKGEAGQRPATKLDLLHDENRRCAIDSERRRLVHEAQEAGRDGQRREVSNCEARPLRERQYPKQQARAHGRCEQPLEQAKLAQLDDGVDRRKGDESQTCQPPQARHAEPLETLVSENERDRREAYRDHDEDDLRAVRDPERPVDQAAEHRHHRREVRRGPKTRPVGVGEYPGVRKGRREVERLAGTRRQHGRPQHPGQTPRRAGADGGQHHPGRKAFAERDGPLTECWHDRLSPRTSWPTLWMRKQGYVNRSSRWPSDSMAAR